MFFFSGFSDEYKIYKNIIYLKQNLYIISTIFTDTFDEFNASLLKKVFFILITSNFCVLVYYSLLLLHCSIVKAY